MKCYDQSLLTQGGLSTIDLFNSGTLKVLSITHWPYHSSQKSLLPSGTKPLP